MSFSLYENQNGCFSVPNPYFTQCVFGSFFSKDSQFQAVDLVSHPTVCFSDIFG